MNLDLSQRLVNSDNYFCFGVVVDHFTPALADALLGRFRAGLAVSGVPERSVQVVCVPGSHEVPWAAQQLARAGQFDCVVAIYVLIGGDAKHQEMVWGSVSHALQQVTLAMVVPVINGAIVTNTLAQAQARCTGRIDRGSEFTHAALEMAVLKRSFKVTAS